MKRLAIALLSTSALCAGLCQVASAADLGVRAVAPPAPVVIAPTWTGFYVGGNVGAGWAKNDTSVSGTLPAAVVGAAVPFSLPLTSQTMSGFIGGVQGGYNYQFGTFVVGVEADGDWGSVNGTAPCLVVVSCTSKITSLVDVGGRAGVVVDKALVYIKGGGAWANTNFTTAVSIAGLNAGQTLSSSRSGAFLGTGIEYAFMPNWTAKVEYD
jgi:outer membrane immunogenic protein